MGIRMVCTGRNKGTMEAYVSWRVPSLPNCTCVDMIYICTHMGIQAGGMESVLAAMNCHPSHPAIQEQVRLSTCSCVSAYVSVSASVSVSVPVSVSQLLLFTQGIVLTFYTTHIVH